MAITSEADLSGVRLTKLEVFDRDGELLGVADRELEFDRAGPSVTDFSRHGTAPFDGRLVASDRTLLRVHGRMEDGFAARVLDTPHTFRLTFVDDAGGITRIGAAIGPPWPTA